MKSDRGCPAISDNKRSAWLLKYGVITVVLRRSCYTIVSKLVQGVINLTPGVICHNGRAYIIA